MRQGQKWIWAVAAIFSLALIYNNCAESTNSGLDFSSNEGVGFDCDGEDSDFCVTANPELLELSIQTGDPLALPTSAAEGGTMTLSGYCHNGNYPKTNIKWALKDASNSTLSQSGSESEEGVCDRGEFNMVIPFDAGQIVEDSRYYIELTLYGLDSNGNFNTNEFGAKRGISVFIDDRF